MIIPAPVASCVWSMGESVSLVESGYFKDYEIDDDFYQEIIEAAQEKGLHLDDDWEEIVQRICGAYDGAPDRGPAPAVARVL